HVRQAAAPAQGFDHEYNGIRWVARIGCNGCQQTQGSFQQTCFYCVDVAVVSHGGLLGAIHRYAAANRWLSTYFAESHRPPSCSSVPGCKCPISSATLAEAGRFKAVSTHGPESRCMYG